MSLFYLAVAAGLSTGPVLNGAILDRLGFEVPFFFGGLILFVGTTIFYFFLRKEESIPTNTGSLQL